MNNRPKNYAPLEMYGKYTVHIGGNKFYIKDEATNKEVKVKCHPDDTFDIGEAIRIGMNRLNIDDIICIGDTVKIVDNGDSYCTEEEWPIYLSDFACKYRYGVVPNNGIECKVVAEFSSRSTKRYLVQPIFNERYNGDERFTNLLCKGIYLMGEKGLKKVNKYET